MADDNLRVPVAILEASCQHCQHSKPRKPIETYLEGWEGDTRPERPKGFVGLLRALWNPSQYRRDHPYKHTGKYSMHRFYQNRDETELQMRKNNLVCTLNPEYVEITKKHYCGQFKPRLTVVK